MAHVAVGPLNFWSWYGRRQGSYVSHLDISCVTKKSASTAFVAHLCDN